MFPIKPLNLTSLLWEPKSPGWASLRNPLQDSRRFEGIDADFKELADAMHQTPNVVEATNIPGLFGKLEDIQSRWKSSVIRGVCVWSFSVYALHTLTVYFSAGFLCVKKLWQSTWKPSVWLSPGFTSSLQLTCWTSCLMGPTHTRWLDTLFPERSCLSTESVKKHTSV